MSKLIDFARDAGAKLPSGVSLNNSINAQLPSILNQYGIKIHNPSINIEGSTVTVAGEAATQQDKNKAIMALGNISGVGRIVDQLTVKEQAQAEKEPHFYEVKSGDTLSKIAKEHYGDANKYPQIFEANKPMLSDPNKIYPGQKLIIPED